MPQYVEVEVEENENTYGVPMRVFSAISGVRVVLKVRVDCAGGVDMPHWVTGWTSAGGGSPCLAYCVAVEDSGAAVSYLVYGGDWGLRFKPVHSQSPWSLGDTTQFGEPCLLLAEDPGAIL